MSNVVQFPGFHSEYFEHEAAGSLGVNLKVFRQGVIDGAIPEPARHEAGEPVWSRSSMHKVLNLHKAMSPRALKP